ncbi:MAG TPA: glutamate--cysteine ligase, partial [Myxococcota bacterium]|nr:glutamate--cysteine ligase [Myxococcota bacterium]
PHAMTDVPRYRALDRAIRQLREGQHFTICIAGEDRLETTCADTTAEGANTSLQVHLRVPPRIFAATHAAAQIATAPALAAAGNSPLFLGCRLWEETRIALFKQAVDERGELDDSWRPAARVSFGHGWVREGASELFAESVALHAPLLPVCGEEDPLAVCGAGGVPRLEELRLHHGTVWRWNRAIYDPAEGGHLRIELRALASGPTVADMLANAAFLLGLTLALRGEVDWMLPALPFEHAHRNFYRAAQQGLDATLLWPVREAPSPQPVRARELIGRLLPLAHTGLVAAGVEEAEAARWLGIVAARTASGQTGARWQRRALARLERGCPRSEALPALVARYRTEAASGRPVHEWPAP